ncbi:family 78 glycoside hydrolase catalytic domain [Tessaracoccus sp. MC1627]|uniref:alpha-L-rhamnosidase n=1 Tax=Tessaracoccus sp. MC1627 TaxID=2760312 RepID=UPI00160070C2|nr:alpha-L-rhamnosidase [Tessaracoccus sp. MC1627]MBB1511091.1 family 78 glycoside hydrolase catalytic domain [Tessaracoccus sp. MC1627]
MPTIALTSTPGTPRTQPSALADGWLTLPDLTARFIGSGSGDVAVPVYSRTFVLDSLPDSAVLRSTFLGIGTVRINGVTVGDEVLEPGWQSYHHRLVYRSHEVGPLLVVGVNQIEAEVAPGWYSGRLGFFQQREIYGTDRGLMAQLDALRAGEWAPVVSTDTTWSWHRGATTAAELYDGETYDARIAHALRTDGSKPVEVLDFDMDLLEPRIGPPVRRIGTVRPASIFRTPSGKVIVDFGRNLVGWVRICVRGESGDEVTLRHAEVLEHDELGVRPLRTAQATDRYILAGVGEEAWEPSFTCHGFRFVQVDGWPGGEPSADSIEAVVVYSDMPRAGWFRTSHAAVQQLHHNVVASTEGNFVSIPTDCPQRDERLGWTGDIAVFAPTASFLFDTADFLRSWLRDVSLEQREDGSVPTFVPEVPYPDEAPQISPQFGRVHAAVWGDATTMVPAAMYEATGDVRHLRDNFAMMRKWVDGVAELAGPSRIRDTGFQFGDWLDPTAPPHDPAAGATQQALVATAYFAHSARLTARAAEIIGDEAAHKHYAALASEVSAAFRARFVTPAGRMTSHSQTAYAVAICLELLSNDDERAAAGRHLVELVREGSHRIGTGFVGTPLLLHALTQVGAVDDAYRVLLNEECPSWLYAVGMGATTIWERWDSMLPDGSINPGEMTSFNHYAFGAVADWLHRTVAGIQPAEPGYRRIRIAPRPRRPLRDAGATHLSPFGPISVDWSVEAAGTHVRAVIPDGTVAEFDLEGLQPFERGPGIHEFWISSDRTSS